MNILKTIKTIKNPYLIFLPFLFLYVGIVLMLYSKVLWGDEIRHLDYAQNLFHGFYSLPSPDISLDTGPGYPLFILPFIVLHIPLVCVSLMNAVFIYFSIICFFKAMQHIFSFRTALVFSLFLACYFNFLEFIALMYSESLTLFLVSLFLLLLIKSFNTDKTLKIETNKYIYLSGFILGFLVLTKIIFGYVLLIMLIGNGLLWIINRKAINYRKSLLILLIGLATTGPYLIYTYHLTGRIFYWGTSGGNNLYWMSTPYEREFGNWIPNPESKPDTISTINSTQNSQGGGVLNIKNRSNSTPGSEDSLRLHHQKDFEEIYKYKGIERDDAYKKIVINNIKSHPAKYIENCISNVGRILFNYPYSYTYQKPTTLLRLPLNGTIVVFMLFSLIPTFINWKKIIFPIRFMLFFTLFYLGGSIFGSAEIRMFTIIVPILLFWIAYIIQKSMIFKLKFDATSKEL